MSERIRERMAEQKVSGFRDAAIASGNHDVAAALDQVRAAGIPFIQIALALMPFILSMLSGKPIDWQAAIAAILALLNPPAPKPAPIDWQAAIAAILALLNPPAPKPA